MSHLDWAAELPTQWEAKPLRSTADYVISNVDKVPADTEIPVRLCNYTDVYNNEFITLALDFMQATASEDEIVKFGLVVDDVVITKDSESWDDIGVPVLVRVTATDLVRGYHLALLRPHKQKMDGAFLFRCLQAKPVRVQLELAANGVTRFGIPKAVIGALTLPVPSLPQQRAIADYLDRATARLDALVAAKGRVLVLLAEKRCALITRAVTRGLNDRIAPFMRLKFLLDCIDTGFTPQSHNVAAQEGQCGVLKSGCVNGGIFNPAENKLLPDETEPPPELEVRPGDVLMSRASGSTELIGSVALVREQPVAKLYLSDKTFRLRVNVSKCAPAFIVFAMGSTFLRNQIEQGISGAEGLANNIAQSDIREFLMPVPPLAEQRAIVAYVAAQTAKLDGLRAVTERTIALLKERRAALIAAAVTGQIDVGAATY